MSDVFISYSREDVKPAKELVSALKAAGYDVFWDLDVPDGKRWRNVIEAELDAAKCVLVLWSIHSRESDWVLDEAQVAKDRGVLLPYRIDEVRIPIGFLGIHARKLVIDDGVLSACSRTTLLEGVSGVIGHAPDNSQEHEAPLSLASLASALEMHAADRELRKTIIDLFEAQVEGTGGVAAPLRDLERIAPKTTAECESIPAATALVIADCLAIAAASTDSAHVSDPWQDRLMRLCRSGLEQFPEAADRNALFLALGEAGWDSREGVGLHADGCPDILWLPVPHRGAPKFYIAKYLVTNAQFLAFLDDDYDNPRWWVDIESEKKTELVASRWCESNTPRTNVTWYAAVAFTRWLSEIGTLPHSGWTIGLPKDSEWLASYTGLGSRGVPWNAATDSDAHANTLETGLQRTSCVGVFPLGASPCGADDMAGNVWEWCVDEIDALGKSKIDTSNKARVVRGGSWNVTASTLDSSFRQRYHPDARNFGIGFRVVCRPSRRQFARRFF